MFAPLDDSRSSFGFFQQGGDERLSSAATGRRNALKSRCADACLSGSLHRALYMRPAVWPAGGGCRHGSGRGVWTCAKVSCPEGGSSACQLSACPVTPARAPVAQHRPAKIIQTIHCRSTIEVPWATACYYRRAASGIAAAVDSPMTVPGQWRDSRCRCGRSNRSSGSARPDGRPVAGLRIPCGRWRWRRARGRRR